MTHSTQAQIEAAAKALYQREMERGEHANKVFSSATNRTITGASVEPFEEYADMWREDAKAALTAAAQVGECKTCGGLGYLVGDAEWEPYAVQCPECKAAAQVGGQDWKRLYEFVCGLHTNLHFEIDRLKVEINRLNAATQVGNDKSEINRLRIENERNLRLRREEEDATDKLKIELAATIERCAQVAESKIVNCEYNCRDEIVAAIRKLKDAP